MKQMKAVRDVYARVDRRSGSVAENAYLLGSQMVQCVVLRGVTVNIVTYSPLFHQQTALCTRATNTISLI